MRKSVPFSFEAEGPVPVPHPRVFGQGSGKNRAGSGVTKIFVIATRKFLAANAGRCMSGERATGAARAARSQLAAENGTDFGFKTLARPRCGRQAPLFLRHPLQP
jgi:hypothetical protein